MVILAHRGYWCKTIEQNTPCAIKMALEKGYGFESDVRDYRGQMVISHNIADETAQDAEEIFKWLIKYKNQHCFAINIKADGLKDILNQYIQKYGVKNYFLFDMSVPQMIEFRDLGLIYFTRQSEVEPCPCLYDDAAGIWIDGFWTTDWITETLLQGHIKRGKRICLVSPDLHGSIDYKKFWKRIKSYKLDFSKMMLCTDHPDEAKEYFYGEEN